MTFELSRRQLLWGGGLAAAGVLAGPSAALAAPKPPAGGLSDAAVYGVPTLNPLVEQRADLQPGFFQQLAACGLLRGFAQFLRAAGQAPLAERRGSAAADQQHGVRLEHDDADADQGADGVLACGHVCLCPG